MLIAITILLVINVCHANFTLKCLSQYQNVTFARGDPIPICLHVMDNVNVEAFRLTFQINVDQYTAIDPQLVYITMLNNYTNFQKTNLKKNQANQVTNNATNNANNNTTNNSTNNATNNSTNNSTKSVTNSSTSSTTNSATSSATLNANVPSNATMNVTLAVQAQTDNVTSAHIPYILNNQVIPLYSLVIQMTQGVVTDIVWDDGCFGGSANCTSYNVFNKCSVQLGTYSESNNYVALCPALPVANTTLCDPKIYISFIGSDSNGNYFDSAGKRISRFREYSIAEMYTSAKNAFSGYKSAIGI